MMKLRKIIGIFPFIGMLAFIFYFLSCQKLEFKEVTKCNIEKLSAVNATTLNVELNVIELSPTIHPDFGICYSAFNRNPTIADSNVSLGSVNESNLYKMNIEKLLPGTKYYFRGYIMNGNETKYSINIKEFITPELPKAATRSSSNVLMNQATLNGTVNAKNISTKVTFEYGITASYGMEITSQLSPVAGNSATNLSADITGLYAATTYHYRIKAISMAGIAYGNDSTFTTINIPAPTAATNAATNISTTLAKINGSVNANGQNTIVGFEYGLTTSYGNTAIPNKSPVSGTENTIVSSDISGLSKNTLYHYRVKAASIGGTVSGDDITFTTSSVLTPSIFTTSATNIAITTATIKGNLNANGQSATVSFEYGTTTSYGSTTNASPSNIAGSVTTSVSANITGLKASTLYHFRVKAVDANGTFYGNDLTFTTNNIPPPIVSTTAATNIIITTANINGTVNANGLSTTVTFEYGTTSSYGSIANASSGALSGNVATNVSSNITGLTANTMYHFRVKAVSTVGTVYGNDVTFITADIVDDTVADIDGNVYNTIIIGAQVWMRENLKTTKYNDGTSIIMVTDNKAWATTGAAYCWYNNNAANYKAAYGALYNWKALDPTSNGNKKICPSGWHVPSNDEWKTLVTLFGGEYEAGGKLKEAGYAHWNSPNNYANNSSGFTALPGGGRNLDGFFVQVGSYGFWWSFTENNLTDPWVRSLNYDNSYANNYQNNKNYGMSVRCIRD